MEIKFSGDFTVKKTPQEVYDFLVDPKRFCPLLPDYQSMEILDARNFLVKLNVGISHIRGTAAVKMSLAETQSPTRAVYEGKGDVPGGSAGWTGRPAMPRQPPRREAQRCAHETEVLPGSPCLVSH